MDDEELFLTGLASGLDLPTAAAMSADDGDGGGNDDGDDDGGSGDNTQTGCGCLSVLLIGILVGSLARLLTA